LICGGPLKPGPVNATYDVVIHYRAGTWPKVYVPGDQLKPIEPGGKIPQGPDNVGLSDVFYLGNLLTPGCVSMVRTVPCGGSKK
jgi:hypothetical protein